MLTSVFCCCVGMGAEVKGVRDDYTTSSNHNWTPSPNSNLSSKLRKSSCIFTYPYLCVPKNISKGKEWAGPGGEREDGRDGNSFIAQMRL